MQYKTLGNTGLLVSKICLGAMTFTGDDPTALSENAAIWKQIGNVGQVYDDTFVYIDFDYDNRLVDAKIDGH